MNELLRAEPQLFTTALARALEFYTQKLGFTVSFTHGDFYAQVRRDRAALNLRLVDRLPFVSPRELDLLAVSIVVQDASALFAEFERRGVPFAQALRTESWSARTFVVRDPDDNLLLFAS